MSTLGRHEHWADVRLAPKPAPAASYKSCKYFDPTGKSVGVVKSCLAPLEKIFCFRFDPNQFTDSPCPVSTRGADRASSRTRGGMRWTREREAMSGDGRAGRKARELRN